MDEPFIVVSRDIDFVQDICDRLAPRKDHTGGRHHEEHPDCGETVGLKEDCGKQRKPVEERKPKRQPDDDGNNRNPDA